MCIRDSVMSRLLEFEIGDSFSIKEHETLMMGTIRTLAVDYSLNPKEFGFKNY